MPPSRRRAGPGWGWGSARPRKSHVSSSSPGRPFRSNPHGRPGHAAAWLSHASQAQPLKEPGSHFTASPARLTAMASFAYQPAPAPGPRLGGRARERVSELWGLKMGSAPPTGTKDGSPFSERTAGAEGERSSFRSGRQMPLSLGAAGWPDLVTCQMKP